MSEKTKSNFGFAFVVGTLIGSLVTYFFAPKWGKKNREEMTKKIKHLRKIIGESDLKQRAQEMFGEVSDEGMRLYSVARTEVIRLIDEVKEDIDKEKYIKLVDQAIKYLKQDSKVSGDKIKKIKERLVAEWSDNEPVEGNDK